MFIILFSKSYSQIVTIPDANFKAKLLQSSATNNIAKDLNGNSVKIDQNNDGVIQISEAENISAISLNNRDIDFVFYFFVQRDIFPIKEIYSLEGISSFKKLKILDCSFAKLTSLDFTNLSHLTEVYCDNNQITEFTNFQFVVSLFALDCSNNLMTNLDLSTASVLNLQGYETEVLFDFRNNNFQYINIQNNRKTAWVCLCSPVDGSCPFPPVTFINTCSFAPRLNGNLNLVEVKVNCIDKQYMWFGNSEVSPNVFVDNCAVFATDESNFKAKFKIYPNPAINFINIETKEKISEVSILDFSGKVLSKQQNNLNKISVDQLPKGNYILKIKSNQKDADYKFIKS